MRNFRFAQLRGSQLIALLLQDEDPAPESVRLYAPEELYPLAADRYAVNLPNLFLDVLDLADGYELTTAGQDWPRGQAGQDDIRRVQSAPSVSLRTLCKRAARAAADGSGNARRFADARDLWKKLEEHVVSGLLRPADPPVTDVRRAKNWRKNQPFAAVRADPQAWFVTNVFSRSNQQKDPFEVYRGLDAVLDPAREGLDPEAVSSLTRVRAAAADNLDYPTYAQVAQLLADSNMLVFHSADSLAAWIRDEVTRKDFVYASTPVRLYQVQEPSLIPVGLLPPTVPVVGSGSLTASNLANKLAPRAKK